MPWYYDSRTGAYAEEAGVLGALSDLGSKLGLGWHEYATEAEMDAAIKANGWPAPTTNPSNPVGKTAVGSAEAAVPDAFNLTFGNDTGLLGRILKVGIGLILIISGLVRLTGVGKTAIGVAGKAAVLA